RRWRDARASGRSGTRKAATSSSSTSRFSAMVVRSRTCCIKRSTVCRNRNPPSGGRPMDLNYAPEDLAFRQATRRWFVENTPAVEPKTLAERKAWHRKMYDGGYVGMLWPKEYGG